MWKKSLKTKLVVSFVLISLVAIVVTGAAVIGNVRKIIEQEVQNKLSLLAEAKEGQLFAYADSLESRTKDFASDGFIRDNLSEINKTGSTKAAESLTQHLINNKKPLDETITCVMVIDLNGKVIASTTKGEEGENVSKEEYFINGKKGVFFTDVEEDGKDNFTISAPLTDKDTGEPIGVLVNMFDSAKLNQILSGEFQINKGALTSSQSLSETLAIHLVDEDKKVLAYGHKEKMDQMVDTIDTLPVQECLNNKKEITGTYTNHFGNKVIGASMCVPKLNWTLMTEINETEAMAQVRELTYSLIIMLLFVLLFVALEIYLISDKIIQPVKDLHKAAEDFANGKYNYRVQVKTNDEIMQLANSFNQMADSLNKSQQELKVYSQGLEQKIAEKTSDLQNKVDDLDKTREAVLNVAEDAEEARHNIDVEKTKTDAIIANIGDGMIATDKNRTIISMSKSAEDLLGWKVSDAIGKHISDWVKMEDEQGKPIPPEKRPIHLVLSTGKKQTTTTTTTTTTTYYFTPKNKKQFPAAVSVSPVLSDEEIIGVVMIFRDITHEREVDRMKTEFISLASHQLRTPLSAIRWFSEMLLNGDAGKMNSEQTDFVENIDKSVIRMVDLVDSLLNISRIESGRLMIDPKPTDLKKLVEETVKELKVKIKEKKQNVVISIHKNLPMINIDPKLIRNVYLNLLTNAIKYSPEKSQITIFVSQEKKEVISQVSDEGYGIPENEQNKVFQKFFRGMNIVKKVTEGTGLGLYLVRTIVESSGGKIWFKSEKDKGTSFWFSLPISGSKPHKGEVSIDS